MVLRNGAGNTARNEPCSIVEWSKSTGAIAYPRKARPAASQQEPPRAMMLNGWQGMRPNLQTITILKTTVISTDKFLVASHSMQKRIGIVYS